jgi:ubiquinone biosynthesis protein COQ9
VNRQQDCFTLEFARRASKSGWTDDSLRQLCADRGISRDESRTRWPNGARSLGWELNDLADRDMLDQFKSAQGPSMADLFLSRFSQNRALKPAIAKLALSDLRHPIDTLARTKRTADLMWRCHGRPRWTSPLGTGTDGWLVASMYSLCVVIWLLDKSPDERFTKRTVRGSLLMIGLR